MKHDGPFISALCIGALFALAARLSSSLADGYRRLFFLPVSVILRALPGFLSITLLLLAAYALLSVRRLGFKRTLARILCLCLAPYWLLWAPLYSCSPLTSYKSLSCEALTNECLRLIDASDALLPALFSTPASDTLEAALSSAERLVSSRTGQSLRLSRFDLAHSPARSLLSGIYLPASGLSYINSDDLLIMLPFTMCHELAHQAGYAREDEAGLVAWQACEEGNDLFRLSGRFNMLLYGMALLNTGDPIGWQRCLDAMSDSLYALFVRCNGLNTAPKTATYRLSQALYGIFQRLNGQTSGYENALCLKMAYEGCLPGI